MGGLSGDGAPELRDTRQPASRIGRRPVACIARRLARGTVRRLAPAVMLVSSAVACSLVGGGDATLADVNDGVGTQTPNLAGGDNRPVVEVLPSDIASLPPLDPAADPHTPLGELRSRYFPVWTADFDAAFPPATCGSAWELDSIAEPVANTDISQYGNAPTMAALAVMRHEFHVSRALAEPSPLAQLCVAIGSVGVARAEALRELKAQLQADEPGSTPIAFPAEVTILAAGPSAMLAVACVAPESSGLPSSSDNPRRSSDGTRLSAYLLRVARGLEDRVVDISYRVSRVENRTAGDCSGMASWVAEWRQHVNTWIDEGQAWIPVHAALSAEGMCTTPPSEGPYDCPRTWPS